MQRVSLQQQPLTLVSVRGHRQERREKGARAARAVPPAGCGFTPHTGLTVHNDGEQAVKERLQPLMPTGYDLVKDLW